MAGWMINCKEYASLLSQSYDQQLTFFEKLSLKMHQIICPCCKHIRKHFDAIRNACRYAPSTTDPKNGKEDRLSSDVCERMKSVLRETAKHK